MAENITLVAGDCRLLLMLKQKINYLMPMPHGSYKLNVT